MTPSLFPELGFYALPGHTHRPADLLTEVREAECLGIGSAWISERVDVKEIGVLAGAAAAVLLAGLVVFGRDGKMATYAGMVVASAIAMMWAGFGARR